MPQETEARTILISLLETTFAPVEVRADRLHASLGDEEPLIGVYPAETRPEPRNKLINEIQLIVQYFGEYELKVDRNQQVDPSFIEGKAEEFRNILASNPRSAKVWYYDLTRLEYPIDPTGNITRFIAHLTARSDNTAQPITETH